MSDVMLVIFYVEEALFVVRCEGVVDWVGFNGFVVICFVI